MPRMTRRNCAVSNAHDPYTQTHPSGRCRKGLITNIGVLTGFLLLVLTPGFSEVNPRSVICRGFYAVYEVAITVRTYCAFGDGRSCQLGPTGR